MMTKRQRVKVKALNREEPLVRETEQEERVQQCSAAPQAASPA